MIIIAAKASTSLLPKLLLIRVHILHAKPLQVVNCCPQAYGLANGWGACFKASWRQCKGGVI